MADHGNKKGADKEKLKAEKAERLASELQRSRGATAPDAIKNRDKLTD